MVWLAILTEELGKLAQAILHTDPELGSGSGSRRGMIEHHAVTTAAVATAMVEKFAK